MRFSNLHFRLNLLLYRGCESELLYPTNEKSFQKSKKVLDKTKDARYNKKVDGAEKTSRQS